MRLIDADKLIDYFKRLSKECYETENRSNGMLYEALCGKVAEQPTAYDVDKVVSELKKDFSDINVAYNNCSKLDDLIYTVKKGGV